MSIEIKYGQFYTWEPPNGEPISWSIGHALEIIGDRPPIEAAAMPPEMQRLALERNSLACEIDEAFAMTTDLSKPIIAIISPIEFVPGNIVLIVIDGWHRIKHSVAINNPNALPVHVLLPWEEEACRITMIK